MEGAEKQSVWIKLQKHAENVLELARSVVMDTARLKEIVRGAEPTDEAKTSADCNKSAGFVGDLHDTLHDMEVALNTARSTINAISALRD